VPSPKEAFFEMCKAKKLANAVAKRFIHEATEQLKEYLESKQYLRYSSLEDVIDGWETTAKDKWKTAVGREAFDNLYDNVPIDYSFRKLVDDFTAKTIWLLVWAELIFWDKDTHHGYVYNGGDSLTLVHKRLHETGRELGVQVVCALQKKYDLNKALALARKRMYPENKKMQASATSNFNDYLKSAGISIVQNAFFPDEPKYQHGKAFDKYMEYLTLLQNYA
jgi:hypothetical protein